MASIVYHPNSSNIGGISWIECDTPGQGILTVQFKPGAIYQSKPIVPMKLVADWVGAESAGKYFHEFVKPKFELEKVKDG